MSRLNLFVPGSVPLLYWPNFFSPAQADEWLAQSLALDWQRHEIKMFGKMIPVPRREYFVGDSPNYRYLYSGSVELFAEPWPDFLLEMRSRVEEISGFEFSTAMGNLYRDGNDSNGYHADDEPELGVNPAIASVSLGQTRTFRLKPKGGGRSISYELNHGDLVVMLPTCQENWRHTIPKTKRLCNARVNWTFRPYDSALVGI